MEKKIIATGKTIDLALESALAHESGQPETSAGK